MQIAEIKALTTEGPSASLRAGSKEHRGAPGRAYVSEERYCNRVIFMRWSNEHRPFSRAGIPGSPPQAYELFLLVFFFHYKVIGDREYAGNAVDLHAGDLLIHLAGDYAFERDVPVFDDDVNGGNSTQLVLA